MIFKIVICGSFLKCTRQSKGKGISLCWGTIAWSMNVKRTPGMSSWFVDLDNLPFLPCKNKQKKNQIQKNILSFEVFWKLFVSFIQLLPRNFYLKKNPSQEKSTSSTLASQVKSNKSSNIQGIFIKEKKN